MHIIGSGDIQYVILSNEFDFTKATYLDLFQFDNVEYSSFPLDKGSDLLKKLYIVHGAQKINSSFEVPGQSLWNRLIFDLGKLDPKKEVCFIYSFRRIDRLIRSNFFSYVNKRFPHVYHVAYWDDLIKDNQLASLKYAKQNFDLVFSYDEHEAKRSGILYYPSFYSKAFSVDGSSSEPFFDVCFVGNAKNRLEDIHKAYDFLDSNGCMCKFVINGVSFQDQKTGSSIEYNQGMTYREVVELSLNSKCILELIQKGSTGQSLRVNESVVYNRKLLTNNPAVKKLPQYNSETMRVFEGDLGQKDISFIKSLKSPKSSYDISLLSPERFIERIESELKK